jgi:hypothetical protein
MTRLQIDDNFGGERLQTMARPVAQFEQARAAPQNDQWKGLATAFAGAETIAANMAEDKRTKDAERGAAYASSMTVAELGKQIKDGTILASESPVFAATVQNVWGRNAQASLERDVMGRITTGEVKFKSPAEADAYLTEGRNAALEGQSTYAIAGFDKGYNKLRGNMMDAVAKHNNTEAVDLAANQATDLLGNKLLEVTGKDFKGTPKEAATALLGEYQFMRLSKALPDAASKGALTDVLVRAAASGKKDILGELLNSDLPDIGSVRSFLGETKAATLAAQAGSQFDHGQRKRTDIEVKPFMDASDTGELDTKKFRAWYEDPANADYVTASMAHGIEYRNMQALAHQQKDLQKARMQGAIDASEHEAQKRVDAALSTGTLWTVQGTSNPLVLTKTGDTTNFEVRKYAEQALIRKTEGLPFEQQVSSWAQNGLTNPNWDNELKAGLLNLSSIGVDSNGKPRGALNEAGIKSIELFKQLDAVNPDAARQTAGEGAYKRFSDIAFLTALGRDPSDAASVASNAASGAIIGSDAGKLVTKVQAQVDSLTANPWYKPDWVARMMGDNTDANTSQVTGTLRRYATLLATSGQYGDADSAIAAAHSYLQNPQVATSINGTRYMRSELPTPPQGGTQEEWFGKFLDKVPKARATELGFNANEVRMEYDPIAKAYRGMVAGVPLTNPEGGLMVYPRERIQQFYAKQRELDILEAVTNRKTNQPGMAVSPGLAASVMTPAAQTARDARLANKPTK